MGRGRSLQDAQERLRREHDPSGDRFVPLRLDFELADREVLSVGGRWDRRASDFDGEATTGVVVRLHAGQLAAVEWFTPWLEAHATRRVSPPAADLDIDAAVDTAPEHVYSALFAGGRRAGKTWIAVALAVAYAIRFPGSIVWLVSPSDRKHDEIRRYIASFVASTWLDRSSVEGWEICNGSQLLLKSAYGTGDTLKEGKANLVVLNEGQMMMERAYVVCRGAIVDASGLVLVCANPPVEAKDQTWVSDFAAACAVGERASVYLQFNPLENPHIDRRALLALKSEVDERTFAIEVLGQFRGPKDAVAYNWVRLENERPPPPEFRNVTRQFLESIGEGEGIEQVAGLDVQRFPYIGGPIYRFYAPPDGRWSYDNVIAWIVGEVVLDGGDELDYCAELAAGNFPPETTLIVCDASGRYQHSRRRSADAPPPEWTGRGSFELIRGEGYTRIVPPDRRQKKNPEIVDRARAFTSMICSGTLVRRLFADAKAAPRTCAAIREWKTVHGTPSRSQTVAHLGDGASYPMIRLFPRRLRSENPRQVDPVAKRVDRVAAPATGEPVRSPPSRRVDRTRGM